MLGQKRAKRFKIIVTTLKEFMVQCSEIDPELQKLIQCRRLSSSGSREIVICPRAHSK